MPSNPLQAFISSTYEDLKDHHLNQTLGPEGADRAKTNAASIARKLAEDLSAKGLGVANGMCAGSQLYKSVFTQA